MDAVIILLVKLIVISASSPPRIVHVKDANVTITSPAFPNDYPPDSNVEWRFLYSSPAMFTINMTHMSLEQSDDCKFDALMITRSDLRSAFVSRLCGNRSSQNNLVKSTFSYGLILQFKSDFSTQRKGFSLHVTRTPLLSNQLCDLMYDREAKQIRSSVDDEAQQYPTNLNCTWEISSPPDTQIVLQFEKLDIEFSGSDCLYDYIEVWDVSGKVNSSADKLLVKLCGRDRPWSLLTNSRNTRVIFFSDSSDNTGEFDIRIKMNDTLSKVRSKTRNTHVTSIPQIEPLFTGILNQGFVLLWKFRTHPGFAIKLHTEMLSTRGIFVHDGPDTSFNQVRVKQNQTDVSSTGFHFVLSIELTVDNVFTQDNITFYCQDNAPSVTNPIVLIFDDFERETHPVCSRTGKCPSFVDLSENFFDWSPNIDNCAYGGLALYDGVVEFRKFVGTFCNIYRGYLRSVLRHLVPSTWVFNVIYYEYRTDKTIFYHRFVLYRSSTCRGYILTDETQKQEQMYTDDNFKMTALFTGNTWNISIQYKELPNDCVSVQVLSRSTTSKQTNLFLKGTFSSRTCRQGGFRESTQNDSKPVSSKYDFSRRCSEQIMVNGETTDTILGFTKRVWFMQSIQIELGTPSVAVREHVQLCSVPGDQTMQLRSGLNPFTHKGECSLRFVLPRVKPSNNNDWRLSVQFFVKRARGKPSIKISEENSKIGNKVLSEIVIPRSGPRAKQYYYAALPGSDIVLSVTNIYLGMHINIWALQSTSLGFEVKRMPTKEKCVIYESHCYVFKEDALATSWLSTQNTCRESGGDLVSVNTVEELQFLKEALSSVWFDDFYGHNRGLVFIGLHNMIRASDYRWVDGSPLTVTDWYYPFDEDNILPYSPSPPVDRDHIQPVPDLSQRCVAMIPGNTFYSTNWRKVKCEESYHSSSVYGICEYNKTISGEHNQTDSANSRTEIGKYRCYDGWNFVHNTCLIVLTKGEFILESYERHQVESMCNAYGGRLPRIDRIPKGRLKSFFISKGFSESVSDIWVKLESSKVACISLFGNSYLLNSTPDKCGLESGARWIAVCETDPVKMSLDCLSYQFSCDDGTCLNPDRICDLNMDCSHGEDESNCTLPGYLYTCDSGQKISVFKKCDFHADCSDGSDENLCIHMPCLDVQFQCKNAQCISLDQRCDQKADCVDGSDEDDCEDVCHGFTCPVVGCIVDNQIEDMLVDCPDKSEADEKVNILQHKRERIVYESFPQYSIVPDCPGKPDHIRCHRDHIKCYPADKVCVYDHDVYGRLKYCSNGAHLKYCEEYECPGMFKCLKSYCIPYHKVCDRVQDCVKGEDETNCEDITCPGMLKCGSSNQCVSQERICDMEVNCKNDMSDEQFCDLKNYTCPPNCTCVGYYVDCGETQLKHLFDITIMETVRVLDLGKNNISCLSDRRPHLNFRYLAVLYLQHNIIQNLSSLDFSSLSNLIYLDIGFNNIEVIRSDAFYGLSRLQTLRMVGNHVHQIPHGCFRDLLFLRTLNLSGMLLAELGPRSFEHLESLQALDLSNNNIKQLSPETFDFVPPLDVLFLHDNSLDLSKPDALQILDVGYLRVDSYRLCCVAGRTVHSCFPPVEDFSSCADLLPSKIIQVFVGVFAVLAIGGNVFVISWRLYKRLPDVPSVLVFHLSVSDLLMGLYLITISVVDLHYQGVYILHDVKWRASVYCKLIGVIGFISCEMSMYTLVFIAIDRTKKLAFPLSSGQFTVSHAWVIELLGWAVWTLLSIIPLVLPLYFGDYYGRNSICLPFNFADPKGTGWEMTTVVFVGFNSVGLMVIFAMYAFIFSKVKQSQKRSGRRDRIEVDVARKLSIIILTDVACMLPIVLANFIAVFGHPIDRGMASILATFMLPLNSALNPFLFTLNTLKMPAIRLPKRTKKLSLNVTNQTSL